MNTLNLPLTVLAAVAPFMAKKDVRYYLNGAMVETAAGGLRAVATDGHALAVCDSPGAGPGERLLIPREAVEWALKQKGEAVTLEWTEAKGLAEMVNEAGARIPVKLIDGRYPEYAAVIPMLKADRTELAGFNPEILVLVAKCAAGLKKYGDAGRYPAVTLHGNGNNNAAGFELGGLKDGLRVIGVVMPLRDSMAPREGFGLAREYGTATPGPECAEVEA